MALKESSKTELQLQRVLRPIRRKMAAQQMIYSAMQMFSLAFTAGTIVLLLTKFTYIRQLNLFLAAVFMLPVIGIFVLTAFKQPSFKDTAVAVDRFGYKERFVTAYEVASSVHGQIGLGLGALEQQVLQEAITIGQNNRLSKLYRFRLPRKLGMMLLLATAFFILAAFMPTVNQTKVSAQKELSDTIEAEIEKLEVLAADIKEKQLLTATQIKEVDDTLQTLMKELRQAKTKGEAIQTLQSAQVAVHKLEKELTGDLQSLGEKLQQFEQTQWLGEALLEGNTKEIEASLRGLNEALAQMSEEQKEAFAQMIQEMADDFNFDADLSEAMAEYAKAVASGSAQSLQGAYSELASTLNALAQENESIREALASLNSAISGSQAALDLSATSVQSATNQQQGDGSDGAPDQPGGMQAGDGGTDSAGNGIGGESGGDGAGNGIGGEGGTDGNESGGTGTGRGSGSVEPESIYSRQGADMRSYDTQIKGQNGIDEDSESRRVSTIGEDGEMIPYDQVFDQYKTQALKELSQGDIPYGMAELVEAYFQTMEMD